MVKCSDINSNDIDCVFTNICPNDISLNNTNYTWLKTNFALGTRCIRYPYCNSVSPDENLCVMKNDKQCNNKTDNCPNGWNLKSIHGNSICVRFNPNYD
jgi:hypothetical protein